MATEISSYLDLLTRQVKDRISTYFVDKTTEGIASTIHDTIKATEGFQRFYFETLDNETHFLSAPHFFREFKKQYALQGINNDYLDGLEQGKSKMIQLIKDNLLADLYFGYFATAQLRHKDKTVSRDLGSFFAKLVHTFRPNNFCALDNPIKDFFGLSKESFYVAFLTISRAYKEWANDEKGLIQQIRQELTQVDELAALQANRMTDLKLFDLIFWSEANRGKTKSL